MVTKRGDLMFVITQCIIDISMYHHFKSQLHFGSVLRGKNKTSARFIVQNMCHISLIIDIFNGHMILHTFVRIQRWIPPPSKGGGAKALVQKESKGKGC